MQGDMNAVESAKAAMRELLKTTPYDQITISVLCKQAGISRKAYYRYFSDKKEIIRLLVEDDHSVPHREVQRILPLRSIKSAATLMLDSLYTRIYEDKEYYTGLVSTFDKMDLIEIMIEEVYQLAFSEHHHLDASEEERDYMAYALAAAETMTIIRWIERGMIIGPKQMSKYHRTWLLKQDSIVDKDCFDER